MDVGSGFGGDDRQRYLRIALIAGVALVVLLLILIVAAIVRNRASSGADPTVTPTRGVTRSPILASTSPSARPTVAVSVPPSAAPSGAAPSAAAPSTAAPSAAAGRAFVVGNTGGDGVRLRSEPSTTAQEVALLPDGHRLVEVGPGRNSGGRDWLNVRDESGNVGWVAAEFATPAP